MIRQAAAQREAHLVSFPFKSVHSNHSRACCVRMGSRNPLYIVVFRASSHVQMIPSERDLP